MKRMKLRWKNWPGGALDTYKVALSQTRFTDRLIARPRLTSPIVIAG